MNGLILVGGNDEKDTFIKKFISEHDIPSYNIFRYPDKFKIADSREMIRRLAISTANPRLFVLEGEPTLTAQNSLLKALEELADDSFIIFSCSEALLPTITSRCSVKILDGRKEKADRASTDELFDSLKKKDFYAAAILIDGILDGGNVEVLILGIRKSILNHVQIGQDVFLPAQFLKKMNRFTPLINKNNLNSRLAAERALIESLEKHDDRAGKSN